MRHSRMIGAVVAAAGGVGMWAASPTTDHAPPREAVHISMPHGHPERRYAYLVTLPHDQVVISPPNRGNSISPRVVTTRLICFLGIASV